ncbi:MAG: flagellar hook-basal body complex protein FliE [Pusillimonas sp.]
MAIEQVPGLGDLLGQMRSVAEAAGGRQAADALPLAQPGGFAAELQRSIQQVAAMQNASAAQARSFQLGDPNVSLNDVMIDMQKASIAFQTTVQVRNRLVSAYQEIASMPI